MSKVEEEGSPGELSLLLLPHLQLTVAAAELLEEGSLAEAQGGDGMTGQCVVVS